MAHRGFFFVDFWVILTTMAKKTRLIVIYILPYQFNEMCSESVFDYNDLSFP